MAVEGFNGLHNLDDYDKLYLYQVQTPATYGGAKPRLHAFARNATLKLVPEQWEKDSPFSILAIEDFTNSDTDGSQEIVPPTQEDGFMHCPCIDVLVTSRYEVKEHLAYRCSH